MATKDMRNDLDIRVGLEPQADTTGTSTGVDVDTRGYESVTLMVHADTAYAGTVSLQEGDTTTSYSAAGADDIIGTNGDAATAGGILTLGYTGSKRYVRVVATTTTAGDISCAFILGNAHVCKTGANL
jgi:hypothetical protein